MVTQPQTAVKQPWTPAEDRQLLLLVTGRGLSYAAAATKLGRTKRAVASRLMFLRHGHHGTTTAFRDNDARCSWTPDQDSLLLLHYGSMGRDELADLVGKTPKAVKTRVSRLRKGTGTARPTLSLVGRGKTPQQHTDSVARLLDRDHYPVSPAWSAMDDFRLRLFYGARSVPELASALGRTTFAVQARLSVLGWSLDKAIAFRFEVARSPLWLAALEALQKTEAEQYAAVEAERHYQRALFRTQLKRIKHITDLPALVSAFEDPTV